jgi:hypothetical protein
MPGFKFTYCWRCRVDTTHDLYISDNGWLYSKCTECGDEVSSDASIGEINGKASKSCHKCQTTTEHIRYTSGGGSVRWFCCSCGKDV